MTYNRPECVINAIESVRIQSFTDFTLIVSDNSTNGLTEELIKKTYPSPDFNYVKREPSVGGIEHLNLILSEVTSDYFMIFHDDDVMHVNMIESLYNKIQESESYAAVAGNAYAINPCKGTKRLLNKNKQDACVLTTHDMCVKYLTNNVLPFPSYLYRSSVAKKVNFDRSEGGKYCDSTFIIKLLNWGTIYFISEPLMDYYEHPGQDSSVWAFWQKNDQIRFIMAHSGLTRKDPLILNCRIQNLYYELSSRAVRNRTMKLFFKYSLLFMKYSPLIYFPRFVLKTGCMCLFANIEIRHL